MKRRKKSIWVFRPRRNVFFQNQWISVFRRTHTVLDLQTNSRLLVDVSNRNSHKLMDKLFKTFSIIKSIIKTNEITKYSNIVMVGHSLGATIVSAMIQMLRKEGYRSAKGFLYDSPELPKSFHRMYEPSLNLNVMFLLLTVLEIW